MSNGTAQTETPQWLSVLFLMALRPGYHILCIVKRLCAAVLRWQAYIGGWDAILKIYDAEDRAILSGILAFWFVGRAFRERAK